MPPISRFEWVFDSPSVSWDCDGVRVEKCLSSAIRSAVALHDLSGVAVVERAEAADVGPMVVFDCDGTERFRVAIDAPPALVVYYDQAYYVGNELTLFVNVGGNDFAFVIDERTGEVVRRYEAR